MDGLARSGGYLLMAGGALMVVLLVILAATPASQALYAFFVVTVLTGLGVLGVARQAGSRVGRFGQACAWAAAAGGLAVIVVGAYAIATDQFSTDIGGDDPLGPLFALTSSAWMFGSLGFAIALVRARAIPAAGAWLVLAGTVSAFVIGSLAATSYPALSYLSAVPFGLGWVVMGSVAIRPARWRAA
jgi:hypothetical protein